ncbi:follicle-stimulating hormone receptor-like [Tropilaelaps mercedesae]|uniref:Follicle-stimulating hormone receptor-like n=1 Tax=Tropilaelaps mercedesae TaxID=418985 RepID=A0A1V9XY91_9ACAR|nr:follicle-stimulating hormone receptor-like [Tropilaelaps mercedesae]
MDASAGTCKFNCGPISLPSVTCSPASDAFNPCEDVMGTRSLRVAVWFVVLPAVVGNLAVMVVLMSSRFRMTVSKFLMCNLAFADLCMGVYLLMIAIEDVSTIGSYFNHAIQWQHGTGCKIAGFLTVFASELSIYTLTTITLERWYAITYTIHLNRRLKVRTAAKIMAVGWTYAAIVASLPLLGVSGYTKTSICIPMENR